MARCSLGRERDLSPALNRCLRVTPGRLSPTVAGRPYRRGVARAGPPPGPDRASERGRRRASRKRVRAVSPASALASALPPRARAPSMRLHKRIGPGLSGLWPGPMRGSRSAARLGSARKRTTCGGRTSRRSRLLRAGGASRPGREPCARACGWASRRFANPPIGYSHRNPTDFQAGPTGRRRRLACGRGRGRGVADPPIAFGRRARRTARGDGASARYSSSPYARFGCCPAPTRTRR